MNQTFRGTVAGVSMLFAVSGHGACVPVQGVVTSVPDAACQINGEIKAKWLGQPFEQPDPLLNQIAPIFFPPAAACVSVRAIGTAQLSGFGGLTAVGVRGLDTRETVTPLGYAPFAPDALGVRSTLTGFTAQSVLSGSVSTHGSKKSGTIFTKDTGTAIISTGMTSEILQIVGGTRDFLGATGTIAVAGQELGGIAVYTGEICTAD